MSSQRYFDLSRVPCPQGGTIVDIGMNQGQFATEAIEAFHPARFLGVEMLPDVAMACQQDLKFHSPTHGRFTYCTAVGDRCGHGMFFRANFDQASSLLQINSKAGEWYGRRDLQQNIIPERTSIHTLDCVCSIHNIESIDLLKIDVQGYEGRVLRGGASILHRTQAIIIEVLFAPVYAGQEPADGIEEALRNYGFEFSHWLRKDLAGNGRVLEGDALYVRK